MRWSSEGSPVATTLFEAAALHYAVRLMCRCGRHVSYNAHGLWWHFEQRRWDGHFKAVARHFYCRFCRQKGEIVRPSRVDPVRESAEHDVQLPLPPEDTWKRAIRTFR